MNPISCPKNTKLDKKGQCKPIKCPPLQELHKNGVCKPLVCPKGTKLNKKGQCVIPDCPKGQQNNGFGKCVPLPVGATPCPSGSMNINGKCILIPCPVGTTRNLKNKCIVNPLKPCPKGTIRNKNECKPIVIECPKGTLRDDKGRCIANVKCPPVTTKKNGICKEDDNKNKCAELYVNITNKRNKKKVRIGKALEFKAVTNIQGWTKYEWYLNGNYLADKQKRSAIIRFTKAGTNEVKVIVQNALNCVVMKKINILVKKKELNV